MNRTGPLNWPGQILLLSIALSIGLYYQSAFLASHWQLGAKQGQMLYWFINNSSAAEPILKLFSSLTGITLSNPLWLPLVTAGTGMVFLFVWVQFSVHEHNLRTALLSTLIMALSPWFAWQTLHPTFLPLRMGLVVVLAGLFWWWFKPQIAVSTWLRPLLIIPPSISIGLSFGMYFYLMNKVFSPGASVIVISLLGVIVMSILALRDSAGLKYFVAVGLSLSISLFLLALLQERWLETLPASNTTRLQKTAEGIALLSEDEAYNVLYRGDQEEDSGATLGLYFMLTVNGFSPTATGRKYLKPEYMDHSAVMANQTIVWYQNPQHVYRYPRVGERMISQGELFERIRIP